MKKFVIFMSAVALVAGLACAGKYTGYLNKGNSNEYLPEKSIEQRNFENESKTVIFLGSSVTCGSQARGRSFVEYLKSELNINPIKEAVSGTTLVDNEEKSYISRLKNNIPTDIHADLFICQLSTNDASKGLPLGEISNSFELDDFDTQTIIGATEYIICYAKQTWKCPVAFYTGTDFGNEEYAEMVDALYLLKEKWDIDIIDLYHILNVDSIDEELYHLYMNDPIHPTMKGYKEWWTPVFKEYLRKQFSI